MGATWSLNKLIIYFEAPQGSSTTKKIPVWLSPPVLERAFIVLTPSSSSSNVEDSVRQIQKLVTTVVDRTSSLQPSDYQIRSIKHVRTFSGPDFSSEKRNIHVHLEFSAEQRFSEFFAAVQDHDFRKDATPSVDGFFMTTNITPSTSVFRFQTDGSSTSSTSSDSSSSSSSSLFTINDAVKALGQLLKFRRDFDENKGNWKSLFNVFSSQFRNSRNNSSRQKSGGKSSKQQKNKKN